MCGGDGPVGGEVWEVWWGWACRRRGVEGVLGMGLSATRCGRCGGDGHVGGEVRDSRCKWACRRRGVGGAVGMGVWWGWACRRRGLGCVVGMDMSEARCGRCDGEGEGEGSAGHEAAVGVETLESARRRIVTTNRAEPRPFESTYERARARESRCVRSDQCG